MVLSLLLAVVSFPVFLLIYAPGIDGSLFWVFNYFADGHFQAGRQVLFPHGPLAFLNYPLDMGRNLDTAIVVYLLVKALLVFNAFRLRQLVHSGETALVSLALLILLSVADLQLSIFVITLLHCLLYLNDRLFVDLSAAALFAVLNLFIKTYGGAICGLLLTGTCVFLVREKAWSKIWQLLGLSLLFMLTAWLLLYQSLEGLLIFLRGQIELALDNSEAVSFNQENNWALVALTLLAFLFCGLFSRERVSVQMFPLLILPAFAAWKHAMARGESLHLGGFLNFLIVSVILLYVAGRQQRAGLALLGLLCIAAFHLNITLSGNAENERKISLLSTPSLYQMISDRDNLRKNKKEETDYYLREQALPADLRAFIGDGSVDVYPWNYSLLPKNKLIWQPRPVLNSYAAYTPWLDEQDSKHFEGSTAPRFLLWELSDIDENGRSSESIDHRYFLNDEPRTLLSLLTHYQFRLRRGKYLLYERRGEPRTYKSRTGNRSREQLSEWIHVPEPGDHELQQVRIFIRKTGKGRLKSWLYKGDIFYVFYRLENGEVIRHRFVPKNAADGGLWLNPLVLHPDNPAKEFKVRQMMVACYAPEQVKDVEFEFTYTEIDGITDFAGDVFGKREQNEPVFSEVLNVADPSGMLVGQGENSKSLRLLMDSCRLPDPQGRISLLFNAFVKAAKNTEAQLVVSRDSSGGSDNIIWSKDFRELVDESGFLTEIYFSTVTSAATFDFKRPLFLYVKNCKACPAVTVHSMHARVEQAVRQSDFE